MDDELNVLPLSSHVKHIVPVELQEDGSVVEDPSRADQQELKRLIEDHKNAQVARPFAGFVQLKLVLLPAHRQRHCQMQDD